MHQPHLSQIQKTVRSSHARRRVRGLGLVLSIQLCLLTIGACAAAGPDAASGSADSASEQGLPTGQTGAPSAAETDAALSAVTDDPDAVTIHLYDCSPREHAGVFASINRILKERGLPYRIQVTPYHKTVWSGCEKQRVRYMVEYIKEHQPETVARYEAQGFDMLTFFLKGRVQQGYDIDRDWQGVEETRLYFESCRAAGEPVDLIILPSAHVYTPVSEPVTAFIRHDLIANLDHLMETPAGQKLKSSYPETVWQTLLTDGRQYLLPGSMALPPDMTADCWMNRPLAERYGIDIGAWGRDIWNHRDELLEVWTGEHQNSDFELLPWSYGLSETQIGLTQGVQNEPGIVFNEAAGQFESYYALDAVQQQSAFFRDLVEKGYVSTEPPPYSKPNRTIFLSDENPADLTNAEDYEPIGSRPAYFNDCFFNQFAIASWSRQPEAAFELFCLLYTDSELNKLLIEANGQAERHPISGEISCDWGNPFLYAGNLEAAAARLAAQPKSGLYGQTFDLSDYTEELNALADYRMRAMRDQMGWAGYDPARWAAELDQLGLGRILSELNRQLPDGSESGPDADDG